MITVFKSFLGAILYVILFLLMFFGSLWLMTILDPGYFVMWFI